MIQRVLLISVMIVFFSNCGATKNNARSTSKQQTYKKRIPVKSEKRIVAKKEVSIADKIIWSAVSYKGTPYKYAGTSKSGMDCSGLVYTSFKERNINMPRTSSLMYKEGYTIPLANAKRGDLLFFKTTKKSRAKINHVAIVSSVKNGIVKFMHATSSRGVIESSMLQDYWRSAFVEAKRVL